jgi:hypothetical protein
MSNLLRNGGFEAEWSDERSHQSLRIVEGSQPQIIDVENIFTPPAWLVWFRHEEGEWAQPEVRDARNREPNRMRTGDKGLIIFTFYRRQDAGLIQQVTIAPGTKVRFTIWAHAWSNHQDPNRPGRLPAVEMRPD